MNIYLFGAYVRIDLPGPKDVCLVMRPSTAHALASVIDEGRFGRHELDGIVVWLKQDYPGWTNIKFDGWHDSMTFTDGGRSKVADMIRRVAFVAPAR